MLYALDMSVHSTHKLYGVECPCRGLHTLVMGLSAVTQISSVLYLLLFFAITILAVIILYQRFSRYFR